MKKNKKILISIIIFIVLALFMSNTIFADSDLTNGVKISTNKQGQFDEIGNTIFSLVRTVGIIASVVALMIIGIKYMIGSIEEKAEYKKTLPIYLFGIILIFGILIFAEMFYDVIQNLLNS